MPVDILSPIVKGIRLDAEEMDQNLFDLRDAVNASHKETLNVNTDIVLTNEFRIILVDASVSLINLELPPVLTGLDHEFVIKKIDNSSNNVVINTYDTDAIEGTTQLIISSPNGVIRIVSNGSSWYVI